MTDDDSIFYDSNSTHKELAVVTRGAEDEDDDPFQDLDANTDMQDLIARVMPTQDLCSLEEYINGDESLPVCVEMDDDSWEDTFLTSLSGPSSGGNSELDEDDEEDNEHDTEDALLPPKLKNFKEAIHSLEDVQHFLQSRGCTHEAFCVGTVIDSVAHLYTSAKQRTVLDYFTSQ